MPKRPRKPTDFPDKKDVLNFIRESKSKVGKREIARAFGLKGSPDRMRLKKLLKELGEDGLIERGHRRHLHVAGELPPVTVIEVIEIDIDGELYARPTSWHSEDDPPRILVTESRRGAKALAPGDRALARLKKIEDDYYEARIMRTIGRSEAEVVGVFRLIGGQGRIEPTDRRAKSEFTVSGPDSQGAAPGDIVLAEITQGRRLGLKQARVKEIVGPLGDPATYSLIAVKTHGIPTRFSEAALEEAQQATPPQLGDRTDLRDIPLITIDPQEARDHDDAVWAAADESGDNPGGWKIIVAIADVAAYVTEGSALDVQARERGNSTYFPDRVVPMIPEALSAGLCSLVPDEDRACLAVEMRLDKNGKVRGHRFMRALMRSHARLSYQQTQTARDGNPDNTTGPLMQSVIDPLFGAYAALEKARNKRQPLDIDVPELRIGLGHDGRVETVAPRQRLDAHRLVEEFMIAANVAAAETLEKKKTACMYRIHEPPAPEKISALREFLDSLDYKLSKGQALKPRDFNKTLERARGTAHDHLVNTVVLRSQSQAVYSPENAGHFGLALKRYAHFTSPIRRYADLLVHRGLIGALGFGDDGLSELAAVNFPDTAEHISMTERRSAAAEREARDRYLAAYMESRIGAVFAGRISGVARFGLFITLDETGADGMVPARHLGTEFFYHDEASHALVGDQTGTTYRLGDVVEVRIAEADAATGSLRFELLEDRGPDQPVPARRRRGRGRIGKGRQRRPATR